MCIRQSNPNKFVHVLTLTEQAPCLCPSSSQKPWQMLLPGLYHLSSTRDSFLQFARNNRPSQTVAEFVQRNISMPKSPFIFVKSKPPMSGKSWETCEQSKRGWLQLQRGTNCVTSVVAFLWEWAMYKWDVDGVHWMSWRGAWNHVKMLARTQHTKHGQILYNYISTHEYLSIYIYI